MNTILEIQDLREHAYRKALKENLDADDTLNLEAEILERLLGDWLIAHPKYVAYFKGDEGWREEYEDLLPIEWDEFIANVEASIKEDAK